MDKLLSEFNKISFQIERLNKASLSRSVSVLGRFIQNKNPSDKPVDKAQELYHKRLEALEFVCWLGLRIRTSIDFYQKGNTGYHTQISKDIVVLIDKFDDLLNEAVTTLSVIPYIVDYMMALSPTGRSIILSSLPSEYINYPSNTSSISKSMINCWFSIARKLAELGYPEESALIYKKLLELNHTHNRSAAPIYRVIINSAVSELCNTSKNHFQDMLPICLREKQIFDQYKDDDTGNYYYNLGYIYSALYKQDDARQAFLQSYHIRKSLYGDTDWYTAVSGCEYCKLTIMTETGCESENYIRWFIDSIEANAFPQVDQDVRKSMEGKALYFFLDKNLSRQTLKDCHPYISLYAQICSAWNHINAEPLLKNRIAYNFTGAFYIETCSHLQAEKAFTDALLSDTPSSSRLILSDNKIKLNLVLVHADLGEYELAVPDLRILIQDYQINSQSGLSKSDYINMLGIWAHLVIKGIIESDHDFYKNSLDLLNSFKAEADIWDSSHQYPEYVNNYVKCVVSTINALLAGGKISQSDLLLYHSILKKIEHNASDYLLTYYDQARLYQTLSMVSHESDSDSALMYIFNSITAMEASHTTQSAKTSILTTACEVLSRFGRDDLAVKYLSDALQELTNTWHSCIKYASDTRLSGTLINAQILFSGLYCIMRKIQPEKTVYEAVLKYKALASLAGRERNRNMSAVRKSDLYKNITLLQNRLALMETANIFTDFETDTSETINKLRTLEAEFDSQFLSRIHKVNFTDISLKKVSEQLPDCSAMIEYVMTSTATGISQTELKKRGLTKENCLGLDVYILQKKGGRIRFDRIELNNAAAILDAAYNFVQILQAESSEPANIEDSQNKEPLTEFLSQQLITPMEQYLQDCHTLYIAPDDALVNLPFGILYGSDYKSMESRFQLIHLECGRDLLFSQQKSRASGSLIIGNPAYQATSQDDSQDSYGDDVHYKPFKNVDSNTLAPLPFTELEVRRVGRYCHADYYIGTTAVKSLVLNACKPQHIHIATHGSFDLENATDSIYSSGLSFAGAKNWLLTGKIDPIYGNGFLTADEISRLDLSSTELVVLSSCMSGMSDVWMVKNFQGLIGAFSAAGVKYVITHLWCADDFATSIFMDAFYRFYKGQKMEPPAALRCAKQYMQKVTVGELKKEGVFEEALKLPNLSEEICDCLLHYSNASERSRLFKAEKFWAGFSCYRCN